MLAQWQACDVFLCLQQVCPEHLRLALLVALAPPALSKLRRSEGYLFLGLHICVCFRV